MMRFSKALLFLNGKAPLASQLREIFAQKQDECMVVCADGAYDYVKGYCVPDLVVGDFDSARASVGDLKSKEIVKLNVKKDLTDGHSAILEMAKRGVMQADIYGALGGRIDHEYCNLALLEIAKKCGIYARIISPEYDIYFVDSKYHFDFDADFVGKSLTDSLSTDSADLTDSIDSLSMDSAQNGIKNSVADTKIAQVLSEIAPDFKGDFGVFSTKVSVGSTISIAPVSSCVHILFTTGLAYPLKNEHLNRSASRGVSNVATNTQILVGIGSGCALIFVGKENNNENNLRKTPTNP